MKSVFHSIFVFAISAIAFDAQRRWNTITLSYIILMHGFQCEFLFEVSLCSMCSANRWWWDDDMSFVCIFVVVVLLNCNK